MVVGAVEGPDRLVEAGTDVGQAVVTVVVQRRAAPQQLHVIAESVGLRDAHVQIDDGFAVRDHARATGNAAVVLPAALVTDRCDRHFAEVPAGERADRLDALTGSDQAGVAGGQHLVAAKAVSDTPAERVARQGSTGRHIPGAVTVVEEPIILVVTQETDVVAKGTIRRRTADLDLCLVIVIRRRDTEVRGRKAGERTGLNNLVDETGRTGARN